MLSDLERVRCQPALLPRRSQGVRSVLRGARRSRTAAGRGGAKSADTAWLVASYASLRFVPTWRRVLASSLDRAGVGFPSERSESRSHVLKREANRLLSLRSTSGRELVLCARSKRLHHATRKSTVSTPPSRTGAPLLRVAPCNSRRCNHPRSRTSTLAVKDVPLRGGSRRCPGVRNRSISGATSQAATRASSAVAWSERRLSSPGRSCLPAVLIV